MNKLRVFTAFTGYGSQEMALRNIGIDFEVVGISEIDKYALKAYELIYGHCPNYGDICKIDWDNVPDFDLFTYSFPCQDISLAGNTNGLSKGSGTRSSLLWECAKAIEVKKPKYLLMENVKNLVSKKFIGDFLEWQNYLSNLGYTNFSQILNAKDYGVPQNRERVFMVSILGDAWYNFPQKQRLTKCLADVLEDNVDEKYYLSEKMQKCLLKQTGTIAKYPAMKPIDTNGVAHTLNARTHKMGKQDNYIIDKVIQINECKESGGKQPYQQNRVYDDKLLLPAIGTTNAGNVIKDRIRRITPLECARLMGVSDDDFNKMRSIYPKDVLPKLINKKYQKEGVMLSISDSKLYKLFGNSIVVPVLEGIFRNLFLDGK